MGLITNVVSLIYNETTLDLTKLMDYPRRTQPIRRRLNKKASMPVGLFFPLGLSVYLIATYQRKLLRQGIDTVMKVSRELKDMINGL
ncbi:MAG: hypothetical protein LBU37_13540 [Tannerellaceae bacterium]|nr:hypothetical protein [Tannerellaceae bacterium]